jgi:glyoxylase-like metal-dependent hydrolase (beta-lactamase superfamily II)
MRVRIFLLSICLLTPRILFSDTTNTHQRTVTQLGKGIYEIRHKDAPDHFSEGNTTVVVGENAVLVVDSCYLPSVAREDIEQIRQWTNKPVRYLFNTHWHNDHTQGNATYAEAFPGISIVAQRETAKLEGLRIPAYLAEYPQRIERFQKELDTGKDPSGRLLTEAEKDDLKNAVAGGKAANEAVSAEFRGLKIRVPDVTFDREFDIDLGNREVQLKFLGRGNTAGDAIAYLPEEKIVIAGDLVDSPVPLLGSGFPIEQIETLKKLNQLDYETLVPGHGNVLTGKSFVEQEIAFIDAVVAAVEREIARTSADPKTRLTEIEKAVDRDVGMKKWGERFTGTNADDEDFFEGFSCPGVIETALAEMWPR